MRVTLITTGSPTSNPRLVKEVNALQLEGHSVKVICSFGGMWTLNFDRDLMAQSPGTFVVCGGNPVTEKAIYVRTRLRHALCRRLFKYVRSFGIAENAISRTHAEAVNLAKNIATDLFIAHNLGALPAAVIAAQHQGAKIGYDAEDMHSGQFTSSNDSMYQLNKLIEEKYFIDTDYFTAASPLIAQHYKLAYNYLQPVVVNNVFPRTNLAIKRNYQSGQPLKLFWFSQHIGASRGIEDIIVAMGKTEVATQLHLLGNCTDEYRAALINLSKTQGLAEDKLHFHPPVPAEDLFSFAAQFDIGMASETAVTLNRDICLTNKIFTYLQSGLAILASDTQAQNLFLSQYPAAGKIYLNGNISSLTDAIEGFASDAELLYQTRLSNYKLGQEDLNWEIESEKFKAIIKNFTGE